MISNRCARKSLVTNCNSIISKNYLRFLVDSNDFASIQKSCRKPHDYQQLKTFQSNTEAEPKKLEIKTSLNQYIYI